MGKRKDKGVQMIIAYGMFGLSLFLTLVLVYGFIIYPAKEVKEKKIGLAIFFWFFILLLSAQYIWG